MHPQVSFFFVLSKSRMIFFAQWCYWIYYYIMYARFHLELVTAHLKFEYNWYFVLHLLLSDRLFNRFSGRPDIENENFLFNLDLDGNINLYFSQLLCLIILVITICLIFMEGTQFAYKRAYHRYSCFLYTFTKILICSILYKFFVYYYLEYMISFRVF